MQKHVSDESNGAGRPSNKEKRARTRSPWFLFSGLGFVLLGVIIAITIIQQLTYNRITYAAPRKTKVTTTTSAKLIDDSNAKKITFSATVQTSLKNTNILAHVHGGGSCTGPILFMLHGKTDGSGQVNLGPKSFSKEGPEAGNKKVPNVIPNDWRFNVHDAKVIDPKTSKPQSLGCSKFTSSQGSATANFTKTVNF